GRGRPGAGLRPGGVAGVPGDRGTGTRRLARLLPGRPRGVMNPVLLGVRHHGPGSARAVRRALAAYQPEVVLIEGPPEADPLVPLAGDEDMRAPVALLAYPAAAADPRRRAAFWPFAEFSPEWQALRWAVAHEVPVQFIDLPAAVQLATEDPPRRREPAPGLD